MGIGKGLGACSPLSSMHHGAGSGTAAPGWLCFSFCSWLFWWKNRSAPLGTAEVETVSLAGRLPWQGSGGAGGAWLGTDCPPFNPLCFYVALQAQG